MHGLPGEVAPETQAAALAEVRRGAGVEADTPRWASPADLRTILALLGNADNSFTRAYAAQFDIWLRAYVKQLPEDTDLVLIAYSLSGAFVYRWIQSLRGRGALNRIRMIVTLGAPYRVPFPLHLEQRPDKSPIPARELPLHRRLVLTKLRRARVPLRMALAWRDGTIPIPCALFPSMPDETGMPGGLETLVIPDAKHLDLCSHPLTHRYLQSWLDSILVTA